MFRKYIKPLLVILAATAAVVLYFNFAQKNNDSQKTQTLAIKPTACLKVSAASGTCDYTLDEVSNAVDRAQGLSGRDGLAPKTGMLFNFEKPAEQCIWMKDMKFNIDIIWLNENKQINRIEESVSPATYPTNYCEKDTKYVVELDSGEAKTTGLKLGQQLNF